MGNPFEYNIIEQRECVSFYKQRNAKYKETAEQKFNINENKSFRENIEPPTPQIMEIDGYDAQTI